jgi:hypothetical protein
LTRLLAGPVALSGTLTMAPARTVTVLDSPSIDVMLLSLSTTVVLAGTLTDCPSPRVTFWPASMVTGSAGVAAAAGVLLSSLPPPHAQRAEVQARIAIKVFN